MWLRRSTYDQLTSRLNSIEAQWAALRLAHKDQYRRLRLAERHAHEADTALAIERHEAFRMVRHLTNMLLRAKEIGAYPLQTSAEEKAETVTDSRPQTFEEAIDPGELEAVIAAGLSYGISKEEAIKLLKREKGFE